ncbi:hypothetical protein Ddc_14030 [Ditylenchus destructor]|nr:hypothetical protein Ddc_14030 [Ditylenchus destructor]
MDIESRETLLSPNSIQISTKRNLWNLFPLDVQLEVFRCLRAYDLYKHGINVSRQWRNTIEYHKNTLPKLRRIPNDFRALNRLAGDTYFEYRQCEIEEFRKEQRAREEERPTRFRYSVAYLLPSVIGYILALVAQRPLSIDKIIATTLLLSITFRTLGTYRKFVLVSTLDDLEIFSRRCDIEDLLCAKRLKYIWPVYLVARTLVFGGAGILKSQSHLKGDHIINTVLAVSYLPEAFHLINYAYLFIRDNSNNSNNSKHLQYFFISGYVPESLLQAQSYFFSCSLLEYRLTTLLITVEN